MKREKLFPDSANYWYLVSLSESNGIPVPWQHDYLAVRKTQGGLYWISFPDKLPTVLQNCLEGMSWDRAEHAIQAALSVASRSAAMYRKVHVVVYATLHTTRIHGI